MANKNDEQAARLELKIEARLTHLEQSVSEIKQLLEVMSGVSPNQTPRSTISDSDLASGQDRMESLEHRVAMISAAINNSNVGLSPAGPGTVGPTFPGFPGSGWPTGPGGGNWPYNPAGIPWRNWDQWDNWKQWQMCRYV